MSKRKPTQALSSQEYEDIASYLSRTYPEPVDFSSYFIVSGPSSRFSKPIVKKNGDVFTLQKGVVYHQSKACGAAKPLATIAEDKGIFVVTDEKDGHTVHLNLIRVTDFASAQRVS